MNEKQDAKISIKSFQVMMTPPHNVEQWGGKNEAVLKYGEIFWTKTPTRQKNGKEIIDK
jgi:hypothetical protein